MAPWQFVGCLLHVVDVDVIPKHRAGVLVLQSHWRAGKAHKGRVGQRITQMFGVTVLILARRLAERLQKQHINHRKNHFSKPRIRRMGGGSMTLHLRQKDGTELPCDISLRPLKTEEDDFVVSSIRDVSEIIETQAHAAKRNGS